MSFLQGLFGPPDIEKLKANRDVQGLIKALGYEKDATVRVEAVRALGKIRDSRAVEPLINALRDSDVNVCKEVIEALGILRDARAVEPLIGELKDSNEFRCRLATVALGKIGDPRAVKPLIALLKRKYLDEAVVSLDALQWQPSQDEAGAAYWIIKRDLDNCIAIGASAIKPLLVALKIRNNDIGFIVDALGRIGDDSAVEPLAVAYHKHKSWQKEIANALVAIGTPAAARELVGLLGQGRKSVGSIAYAALERIGATAIEPLLEISDDQGKKAIVSILLGQIIKDVKPIPLQPFLDALRSKHSGVRRRAADDLGEIGDPRAIELLIVALKDADKQVVEGAAEALVKFGAPAIEQLINLLKDKQWEVVAKAVEILGKIGDFRAVEPLNAVLKDSGIGVRQLAAEALGKLGDNRAVEPLIFALEDKDSDVRSRAATALDVLKWQPGKDEAGAAYWIAKEQYDSCVAIGAPAVKPLIKCLNLYRKDLRRAAARAMIDIYHSTETNNQFKEMILMQRETIIQHTDVDREHEDHPENCFKTHADYPPHIDEGIGIEFPL